MSDKYYTLTQLETKKKFGISNENFKFYTRVGLIIPIEEDLFHVSHKMDSMILEKKTVFRYCFDDSWQDDLKEFMDTYQKNSKVKHYTKEEIAELNKKYNKNK